MSRQSGVHGRIEGETRPGARSSPSVSYHSTNEPVYHLFQAAAARERSQRMQRKPRPDPEAQRDERHACGPCACGTAGLTGTSHFAASTQQSTAEPCRIGGCLPLRCVPADASDALHGCPRRRHCRTCLLPVVVVAACHEPISYVRTYGLARRTGWPATAAPAEATTSALSSNHCSPVTGNGERLPKVNPENWTAAGGTGTPSKCTNTEGKQYIQLSIIHIQRPTLLLATYNSPAGRCSACNGAT